MLPKYTAWAPRYVLSRRKDPDIQTGRSLSLLGRGSSETTAVGRNPETFAAEALQSAHGEGVPVLDSPAYPRQRAAAPRELDGVAVKRFLSLLAKRDNIPLRNNLSVPQFFPTTIPIHEIA
jgi:hypothetical protein